MLLLNFFLLIVRKFYKTFSFVFIFVCIAYADDSWMVYDDTTMATIQIEIDDEALNYIYNNVESDSIHLASIHFTNHWIDHSLDSVGFRLRGNTSRQADKKSFKLDFNHFIRGRDFYGLENLNLNGDHNDP